MSDLQCPAKIIFGCPGEVLGPGGGERGLSERGRVQSRQLAESLRPTSVAGLWAGPDSPAAETASIVSEVLQLPVHADDRLRERDDHRDVPYGDPVPVAALVEEIADQYRGETVVLITHRGVITRALTGRCRNISPDLVQRHPLADGATVMIEVDSSGWSCLVWNGLEPAR
ncbi:hypothetical protein GCM10009841_08160 [Microlunatus panaciterrae]|uniref:Phosphoglycerate mutase n=1 Tax=Microlunatus panaciterrae TaxID=400768 RepID=A0ABS2RHQ1_9ACTN|nr:histidine phosphatase family protein [Microlunatus panaciterrae]MBM7798531.1 putative phosphoglycerate mutase [Microlunatus panaciterrae]